jgi:hypothetical protein
LAATPNISLVAAAQSGCGDSGWMLNWIVCPVIDGFANFIDWVMGIIADSLKWEISSKLIDVWSNFLPIANVAFAVVFMIVIYSTATGTGLNNYSVKKILPRLVVAAVAINVSYYICAALADLSNIVGANIGYLFPGNEDYTFTDVMTSVFSSLGSTIALVLLFVFGGGAVALAALTILLALTARYAVLILLVAISPLAMVCAMLPQTEKWFQKWLKTFVQLLVAYPIFMLAWQGIRWIQYSGALYSTGDVKEDIVGWIITLLLPIAPLFAIIPAMKFGGGLMSKMTGGIEKGISGSPLGKRLKEGDEVRPKRLMNWDQNRTNAIPENFVAGDSRLNQVDAADLNNHASEDGFLRHQLGLDSDQEINHNDAAIMGGYETQIDAKDTANGNTALRDELNRIRNQEQADAQAAANEHNTNANKYNDTINNEHGGNIDNYNAVLTKKRNRGRARQRLGYKLLGNDWDEKKQQVEAGFKRNYAKYSSEELEKSRQDPTRAARLASRMGGQDRYLEQLGVARAQLEDESKKAVEGIKMVIQNDLDLKVAQNPQMDKVGYLVGRFQQTNDTKERAGILEALRTQGGPGAVAIGQMMENVHNGTDKAQMAELDGRVAQMTDVEARNPLAIEAAKRGLKESDIINGSPNISLKDRMSILNGIKVGTLATMQTKYVQAIKDKFDTTSPGYNAAEATQFEEFFNRYQKEIDHNQGAKSNMKGDQMEVWGVTT